MCLREQEAKDETFLPLLCEKLNKEAKFMVFPKDKVLFGLQYGEMIEVDLFRPL